jgi:predicted Zn-ribbon and HTH transcriptional regulator
MPKIITELVCKRKKCGNKWFPKSDKLPKCCPKCKSYKWNEEEKDDTTKILRQVKRLISV